MKIYENPVESICGGVLLCRIAEPVKSLSQMFSSKFSAALRVAFSVESECFRLLQFVSKSGIENTFFTNIQRFNSASIAKRLRQCVACVLSNEKGTRKMWLT